MDSACCDREARPAGPEAQTPGVLPAEKQAWTNDTRVEMGETSATGQGKEEAPGGCCTVLNVGIGVCVFVVIAAAVVLVLVFFVFAVEPGEELGIPELKPPVEQATPSGSTCSESQPCSLMDSVCGGLKLSRRALGSRRGVCNYNGNDPPDCQSPMQILKSRQTMHIPLC